MTSVYKNLAGTISNFFRIGMKGPSISWSATTPTTAANPGDLCIVTGASPKLLQRRGANWLDVAKPNFVAVPVTTATYTCDGTEDLLLVNAPSGTTITLATGSLGKNIIVKDVSNASNVLITLSSTSGQTIDGASSATITTKRGSLRLLYGVEWHVV